jgi:hypothetical protein
MPEFPRSLQLPDTGELLTALDPGLPGLFDMCCLLRGAWSFLELCAGAEREADALLDWSARALQARYADLLESLPSPIGMIVYHDTLGTGANCYLGAREFENLYAPRLRSILATIRARTDAPVLAMLGGASRPILRFLADDGVSIIGVDCNARGMTAPEIRGSVGSSMIVHGAADLRALGRAIRAGDTRAVALLSTEFALATPTIAAPLAPMARQEDAECVGLGAAYLACLDPDQLRQLAEIGPIRGLIETAMRRVARLEFEAMDARPPVVLAADRLVRASTESRKRGRSRTPRSDRSQIADGTNRVLAAFCKS